ncbi:MAG: hypothetical protein K2U26_14180 [Cyclobacteriaceae bacterium]|nr:hypothetical protein [Cyclobacteriaceae bacterium]
MEVLPRPNTTQDLARYLIDLGESGRWYYFSLQAILFYSLLFLALYGFFNLNATAGNNSKIRHVQNFFLSKFLYVFCIISFILISRIPLAVYGFQNPDEALWIALAKTLAKDPRYWISVDGGTGGPLVPFLLTLLKKVDLFVDFGTLKIVSAATMAVSVGFLFFSFTRLFGLPLSRILALPIVVAIAVMKNNDMIAYNSEHIAVLLLSVALYFVVRVENLGAGKYYLNIIVSSLILGSVPFAKLQAVPIAILIGLFACILVYQKLNLTSLAVLIGSALVPLFFTIAIVWSYSGLTDFWSSYVINNFLYTTQTDVEGFSKSMVLLTDLLYVPVELNFFLNCTFTITFFGVLIILPRLSDLPRKEILLFLFSILLLLVSAYCIVAPGRSFPHYVLLFFIPLSFFLGVIIHCFNLIVSKHIRGVQERVIKLLIIAPIVAVAFYHFQSQFSFRPPLVEKAKLAYDGYMPQFDVVTILNRYHSSDERMAIWGWAPELWAGTDFLMGTRDGATNFLIEPGELQDFYIDRYLRDLEKNKPKLFVEAITPDFFGYTDRAKSGFENFPRIKEYIDQNYVLDSEIVGVRIFVRKTKLSPLQTLVSKGVNKGPLTDQFHCHLEILNKNGSFLVFRGWAVIAENSDHQKVKLALVNTSDTLLLRAHQIANSSVVNFSPNNKYNLMCGYLGYIPLNEIPSGDFEIGILVENKEKLGFKLLNHHFNRDFASQIP